MNSTYNCYISDIILNPNINPKIEDLFNKDIDIIPKNISLKNFYKKNESEWKMYVFEDHCNRTDNQIIDKVKDLIEVNYFFAELEESKKKSTQSMYVYIYSYFDKLIENKKFDLCSEILNDAISKINEMNLLVCILMATYPYKMHINSREGFYIFTKENVSKIYSEEQTQKLIAGLK
ncbi:MAG: hypothetical protein H6Q15_1687 [Bacteroidetes bacterium]|nr:hypothetical protein [Bacteroidota bacterium]